AAIGTDLQNRAPYGQAKIADKRQAAARAPCPAAVLHESILFTAERILSLDHLDRDVGAVRSDQRHRVAITTKMRAAPRTEDQVAVDEGRTVIALPADGHECVATFRRGHHLGWHCLAERGQHQLGGTE